MNTLAQLLVVVVQAVVNGIASLFGIRFPAAPQQQRKDFSAVVVRPDDLLVATLDFYNLVPVTGAGATRLERSGAGDSFIILRLPPQSFAEQAFLEFEDPTTNEATGPLPVNSRMAGASKVVFRVPTAELPLPFSLEKILAALTRSAQVVSTEITKPLDAPTEDGAAAYFGGPRGQFTAVEAPFRLVLSPSSESRWAHTAKAEAAGKPVELWHTRLSTPTTARAVYSPDYDANPATAPQDRDSAPNPFRMSLWPYDRHRIVRVTADPDLLGEHAADVDFMALSALGAWLDIHGSWDTAARLVEWKHLLTMGRDEYVRVVDDGMLFETGHRAVLLTITERKIEPIHFARREVGPGAYLRQKLIIIVREPTKVYAHRHVPFRSITVKTLVTPILRPPAETAVGNHAENAFWPCVTKGVDFEFHLVGVDWEGRTVEYRKPLLFISRALHDDPAKVHPDLSTPPKPAPAGHPTFIEALIPLHNKNTGLIVPTPQPPRQYVPLAGQPIAFAPAKQTGDTTLTTQALTFGALSASGFPTFLPGVTSADVDVPDAHNLTGQAVPSSIAFDPTFLKGAGDVIGNASDVFARMLKAMPLTLPKEKTGGLVAPDLDISGLSRKLGPVGGDVDQMVAGHFNPADVFGSVQILGGIELGKIIQPLAFGYLDTVEGQIPGLKTVRTKKGGRDVLETTYLWKLPASRLLSNGPFELPPGADSHFSIETTVDAPLDGSAPDLSVKGELTSFNVLLLPAAPLVRLKFKSIGFTVTKNAKVDFSIDFDGFEFVGQLAFVNELQKVIPTDGFKDPPYLDLVLPDDPRPGINAGFTQAIPTVGIGIFTLQNLAFSAGFYLPLIGAPANLRLAFCSREQPFTLTVSLFGGGGFFAIDIGMGGVTQIEMALEFGAAIAINLGVAAGGVSIMGGVYFQKSGIDFHLSAYVRANGSLSVLGIITVSVEFYISLNYASKGATEHGGKLWGQASVSVKVKIAFFSKSVTLTIEREFAGSDPTFADALEPPDWSEYCAAFANY